MNHLSEVLGGLGDHVWAQLHRDAPLRLPRDLDVEEHLQKKTLKKNEVNY